MMQDGSPPRFVPTLTEVVHDPSDDAPLHGAGASMGAPADLQTGLVHPTEGSHTDPSLASWQAALARPLEEALARVLSACPPPPGADAAHASQALQAAVLQAAQVRHPRN